MIPTLGLSGREAAKPVGFTGRRSFYIRPAVSQQGRRSHDRRHASILKRSPTRLYGVLGGNASQSGPGPGRAYRESLLARVRELGIVDHVVFLNQFVDQATAARIHFDVRRLCHALISTKRR